MKLRTLMLGFFGSLAAGIAASGVVWHRDERTVQTGFPFPVDVKVLRADGAWDCGEATISVILNPLAFFALFVVVAVALYLFGGWRKARAA